MRKVGRPSQGKNRKPVTFLIKERSWKELNNVAGKIGLSRADLIEAIAGMDSLVLKELIDGKANSVAEREPTG